MNKAIHILLLLLIASNAYANQFRGIDIGDSCTNINKYELDQGSEQSVFKGGTSSFNGNILGRGALITYFCENGKFKRGTYIIRFTNYEEAKQFYINNKSYFIEIYGQPDIDGSSIEYVNHFKSMNIELEDHEKQILGWNKENAYITFSAILVNYNSGVSSVAINVQ